VVVEAELAGAITLLFGLMLLVFLTIAGGAIDYAVRSRLAQDLHAAANGAVLAGVSDGRLAFLQGDVESEDDLAELVERAIAARFEAKIGGIDNVTSGVVTPRVEVSNSEIRARADYSGSSRNAFLHLIGLSEMRLGGESSAIVSLPQYYHISLVFDISASMGIGATLADEEIIADQTNCAFACHIGDTAETTSSYEKSRDAGAEIRLDVARRAALTALDALDVVSEFPDQVSFSVHTFDDIPYEIVGLDDPRATNVAYVKAEINDAVFMNVEHGGTNIEYALSEITRDLPPSGSGLSVDDRIHYIVVLTDGVEDAATWNPINRKFERHPLAIPNEPIGHFTQRDILYAMNNTDGCSTLREKNIGAFFIYVEYIHPSFGKVSNLNSRRFGFIEDVLFDIIPDRFSDCGGDTGRVIKATSPDEISEAFDDLLASLISPLRLN